MTIPTLVQNLMNGRDCTSVELWKATVRQLKVELDRLDRSDTVWDEAFVKNVLVYSEAHARLELNVYKIEFEEVLSTPEWGSVVDLLISLQAGAYSTDQLFWKKLALWLQEKGLEEQATDEFPVCDSSVQDAMKED